MRTHYDQILKEYLASLRDLSLLVNAALKNSMQAFRDQDLDLAQQVIDEDEFINQKHKAIEQEAYRIIALQQPVADDLRLIFAVMLSSSDLERIADHADNIARGIIKLQASYKTNRDLYNYIKEMFMIIEKMITGAVEAFVNKDVEAAKLVASQDDQIDKLLEEMKVTTIEVMETDPGFVSAGTAYLYIANSLERIGDYMTNICEQVVYLKTSEQVSLN